MRPPRRILNRTQVHRLAAEYLQAWNSGRKLRRLEDKTVPPEFSVVNAIGPSTPSSRNPYNSSLIRPGNALLEISVVQGLLATYLCDKSHSGGRHDPIPSAYPEPRERHR